MFTELTSKTCPKCKELKSLLDFSNNKNNKDGKSYECKKCSAERIKDLRKKEPEKFKERAKVWRETNPDYIKQWKLRNSKRTKENKRKEYLKGKYGITQEHYDDMRKHQNYKCFTCDKHENDSHNAGPTALNVDHCHVSGKLRKLLCMSCNIALGKVADDISILQNLIKYLKEHNDI